MNRSIILPVFLFLFALLALLAVPSMPAQAQTLKVLHSFEKLSDGINPFGGLIRDKLGNLYGTCDEGGDRNAGTVFKVDTLGNETVLHSFGQALANGTTDGTEPIARLYMDKRGNLYCTALQGGDEAGETGHGTVFKLDTAGNLTVLHIFLGPPDDGFLPNARLLMDKRGNLYGVTGRGGSFDLGTVFKLDVAGNETILRSFTVSGPRYPNGDLVMDKNGDLYGTTAEFGASTGGAVFKLDTSGRETVLHSFTDPDGTTPSGLIMDKSGNLYGITFAGGSGDNGTVFKLDTAGKLTVLHSFTRSPQDGALPIGGLVMNKAGDLFGATEDGGSFGAGTIFEVDTSGNETVLHNFAGPPDGRYPSGRLIMDKEGILYGTTFAGGTFDRGTAFELVP